MDDLIYRSDAKNAIVPSLDTNLQVVRAWMALNDIPAVDAVEVSGATKRAVEVLHGYWREVKDGNWAGGGKTVCSQCQYGYSWKMYFEVERFNYCPNCGARMDGRKKEDSNATD